MLPLYVIDSQHRPAYSNFAHLVHSRSRLRKLVVPRAVLRGMSCALGLDTGASYSRSAIYDNASARAHGDAELQHTGTDMQVCSSDYAQQLITRGEHEVCDRGDMTWSTL